MTIMLSVIMLLLSTTFSEARPGMKSGGGAGFTGPGSYSRNGQCLIVVVQSRDIKLYQDAVEGFEQTSGCAIGEIITLSDYASNVDVVAKIRQLDVDGVLTLGYDALVKVKGLKDMPVFSTMISQVPNGMETAKNLSAVSMTLNPDRQILMIKRTLPQTRRVAVIYDPVASGALVDQLRAAAAAYSITLITKSVKSPSEVAGALNELKGKMDILLIVPDTNIVNRNTVQEMMEFSKRNSIPVVGCSEKYIEIGAVAGFTISPVTLGNETGEIAKAVFAKKTTETRQVKYLQGSQMAVNEKAAEKMGIAVRIDDPIKKSHIDTSMIRLMR